MCPAFATLFTGGPVYTQNPAQPTAEAVVVDADGRIAYAGPLAGAPTAARTIDLAGRVLMPAFNDAHVHIWKLGLLLTVQVDARGAAAPTIAAITAAFAERAAHTPPGTWLTGRGYNEAALPEGRHPTRADLDAASTTHPIALTRTCGHMIVANTRALERAGITRDTPDPAGGVIVRDAAGEPTGLVQETAMGLITRVMGDPDDGTLAHAIEAAHRHQLALGIASATDPLLAPAHLRVYRQLEAEGRLRVRTNGLPIRRPDGGSETLPLPERFVSDWLRIDGVKFFADGGLSGATAAISQPYNVTGTHGVLRFEDEDLFALAFEAHAAGFRLATHAIGDVAIEQVIGVYERVQAAQPRPIRHRIEHLGLPSAAHLARARALGLIAVPQTVFLPALGDTYRRYLPAAFFPRCYPVRAMLDAGLWVALSSDAPVVPDDDPLLGIRAALDRKDPAGNPIAPEQAITLDEALFAYTMGGALASGDEANRGSLAVGKWADLVVLDGDPRRFAHEPDGLRTVRVSQTWVGGALVFEA
jgi:hypothetical protein